MINTFQTVQRIRTLVIATWNPKYYSGTTQGRGPERLVGVCGCRGAVVSTTMLACGLLLLPVLLLLGSAGAGSLRYDQTQTGDTNIHLQIKNVEVLALLDDSAGAEVSREGVE